MARSVTPSPWSAPCLARLGPARTAKNEPRPAGFQHVASPVAAAGLGPAVRDAAHAERGGVVVRCLPGVADREHHGVGSGDRESIHRVLPYWLPYWLRGLVAAWS